jgi:dethiobiotin synthetase
MQGVFITGTNTGVGKTFIATRIARQLSEREINVIPRKPIESGCTKKDGQLIPSDAIALQQAAGYEGALSDICPYRFEPPISPVRAALLANQVISTEQLVNICLQGSEKGFTLVEGAGGFYSPLAENGLNADLALALQLPVVLVANDSLGVLSQVILNVEAIQTRGLQIAAVILCDLENHNDENMDNPADLREYLDCPIYSCEHGSEQLPDELIESLISGKSFANSPSVRAAG